MPGIFEALRGHRLRALSLAPFAVVAAASCGTGPGSLFHDDGGAGQGGEGGLGGDGGSTQFPGFDGSAVGFEGGVTGPVTPVAPATPYALDECTGKAGAAGLATGGPVDAAMKWLYPNDGTIFPGGLLAPVLQWAPQSGGADAVYLHLSSQVFDYKGCFGANTASQLAIPQAVWEAAYQHSNGANDPLHVELTTLVGATASGPIKETWTLALGSLKGSVYYNTYTSPQAMNNGAVMRIRSGATKPDALLAIAGTSPFGPCISCHSLSSNGGTLVAQQHVYPGGLQQSLSFDLAANPTPDPTKPLASFKTDDWGFSAVYPDGSRLLTDGAPGATGPIFPAGPNNNPGMAGPSPSTMYDPRTGTKLAMTGLNGQYAKMPMFSPDGRKIVFNNHDTGGGHSLAVMDFDPANNAFSNFKTIFTDPTSYPGWPFFTPDSKEVIFVLGSSPNYASIANPPLGPVTKGDLYIVDLASGTAHALDAANGNPGKLPYPGRDEDLSFYPTVSPVAAGGYYWVYFTSRRNYGNTIVGAVDAALSKKIWVSAISIDGPPGKDPSGPAFYLPSQEAESGNIRAFATLDPCKANGNTCTAGIDCCGGACTGGVCAKPVGCAKADEACGNAACCGGSNLQCLGGFCEVPAPPIH